MSASASPRPRRRAGAEGAGPVARAVAGAGVLAPEHLADLPPAASALTGAAPPEAAFRQFICRACGLIYDEAKGDADAGLPPGTRFEDIPDDWSCPLCGVGKADFEPCEPDAPADARAAAPDDSPLPRRAAGWAARAPGVVVVGGGRAGWQAAQALRERDPALPITLVSACGGDVYDKPVLSVVHARGLAPEALVRERATDAARRLGVRLLAHTHAVSIDAGARRLRTTRGTLPYRRLVLACGAAPRLPAALPPRLVWRINDLEAYRGLRAALDAPRPAGAPRRRHVLVVGAGLVGCELANDLALGGHAVTLLDTQPRPLAAALPPFAAQRLLEAWAGLPLRFVGGVEVERVACVDAKLTWLATRCGLSFEADAVIAATGLATPQRLARSAGLAYDARAGGIAVDAATLATSDPAIHALGDCVAIGGRASRFVEPIARQARALAAALCGAPEPDGPDAARPVALRIKTGSLPITIEGDPRAAGVWTVDADRPGELVMTLWRDTVAVARLAARAPEEARVRHSA